MLSLLQAELAASRIERLIQNLIDGSIAVGRHLLAAVVVYFVGWALKKLLVRLTDRLLGSRHVDPGVQTFLHNFVDVLLTVLIIVSVLGALGVNTTSFAALLASAGVAVGMALSGNLQNLAGGIVVLVTKPYRVGSYVQAAGVEGVVRKIQIFHTVLWTVDNKVIYLPNGTMSTAVVVNYANADPDDPKHGLRRVDWTVGIDYGERVERAEQAIRAAMRTALQRTESEHPGLDLSGRADSLTVAVSALADSAVELTVRIFAPAQAYWTLLYAFNRAVYDQFNQEHINFPYPQQTVHIARDN